MLLNPELFKELADRVFEELSSGHYKKAVFSSLQLSPGRVASILSGAGVEKAGAFLRESNRKRAGRIISYMAPEFSAAMLMDMEEKERAFLINNIPADHIDVILENIPDREREEVFSGINKKTRSHLEKINRYPRHSAGRIMSPYFLSVSKDKSVAETLDSILSYSEEIDRRPYIYALDEKQRAVGVVSIKDLMRAERAKKVKEVMKKDIATVGVEDSANTAAHIIRNRRLMMIPVIGEKGRIEGVLTFDDAMKVLSEDALNLMTYSAGTYEESFFTPPMRAVKGRLPWMAANVFLNMGAVAVITSFEATIAAVAILAAFIPMITDMGGNVGIQSLSVAIRSIALGEAKLRDFKKLIKKEILIGMVNGLVLGCLFGLTAFFLRGNFFLGLLAGVALGVNVLVAGIVGGALPFFIKALGKDPAMMTGPFLTTVTDITGVSIYLGLSTAFISLIV